VNYQHSRGINSRFCLLVLGSVGGLGKSQVERSGDHLVISDGRWVSLDSSRLLPASKVDRGQYHRAHQQYDPEHFQDAAMGIYFYGRAWDATAGERMTCVSSGAPVGTTFYQLHIFTRSISDFVQGFLCHSTQDGCLQPSSRTPDQTLCSAYPIHAHCLTKTIVERACLHVHPTGKVACCPGWWKERAIRDSTSMLASKANYGLVANYDMALPDSSFPDALPIR